MGVQGEATEMQWRCNGDSKEMQWRCNGDAMEMQWRWQGEGKEKQGLQGDAGRCMGAAGRVASCLFGVVPNLRSERLEHVPNLVVALDEGPDL